MIDSLNPAMFMSPQLEQASEAMRGAGASGAPATPEAKSDVPNFESLLFSMLVKEMRQSMGSEMFPGDTSDILGSMFDLHLGDHMAQFAKLGMNESLLGTLRSASLTTPSAPNATPAEDQPADPVMVQPAASDASEAV